MSDKEPHHDKREYGNIIEDRHKEASEVKQCSTEFTFKGLVLATAFFGVIFKFYPTGDECIPYMLMWFFCGAVILVMMRIVEIGIHKYSTANRHYGYVLHFYRTYDYQNNKNKEKEREIRRIGWEQAMFAWRVIQPILSEEIYDSSFRERDKYKNAEYNWWDTDWLIQHPVNNDKNKLNPAAKKEPSFHPGSYLQKAQRLIVILCTAIFAIFSFFYFKETSCMYNAVSSIPHKLTSFFDSEAAPELVTQNSSDSQSTPKMSITIKNWKFISLYLLLWCFFLWLFCRAFIRLRARRLILEKGLLSIQSCAVVWRLVVLSHFQAVEDANNYKGYTRCLYENADTIRKELVNIHDELMKNIWPPRKEQISEGTGTEEK